LLHCFRDELDEENHDEDNKKIIHSEEHQDEGWPNVFKFPSLPTILAEALKKKDPEFQKQGRSKLRTKLINFLHQCITRYTL